MSKEPQISTPQMVNNSKQHGQSQSLLAMSDSPSPLHPQQQQPIKHLLQINQNGDHSNNKSSDSDGSDSSNEYFPVNPFNPQLRTRNLNQFRQNDDTEPIIEYFANVLDDNEKLQKCAQILFVVLLVVLTFFVPLLLLQICQLTMFNQTDAIIPVITPTPTDHERIIPIKFNIMIFTLIENDEYWDLIKSKLSKHYGNKTNIQNKQYLIRFGYSNIIYNFDKTFDFKNYIKTPNIWKTYNIFNYNSTQKLQFLCKQYDAVVLIQQYFLNGNGFKYVNVVDGNAINTLFNGCRYDNIPLLLNNKILNNKDIESELSALIIDKIKQTDGKMCFSLDEDSFDVIKSAIHKLLHLLN